MVLISKFDKYKKSSENIYPHKHCLKCDAMISEDKKYCDECLLTIEQQKKEKNEKVSVFQRAKNKLKGNKKEKRESKEV